ncbi:zinc finger protein 131-like isoform X2 [Sitophilus oryzae]|uniref:Zinc finger protein 131-like isoform X2 n=1 Tax=Sitophilus oryzae TaxID=7048 RepID=A0A6J2Y5N0_SITOR|nr:zinc finger protein 131-like isoform X2 [Sitophilus oryzae]
MHNEEKQSKFLIPEKKKRQKINVTVKPMDNSKQDLTSQIASGTSDNSRGKESKKHRRKICRCTVCGYETTTKHFRRHKALHLAREERQLFPCVHCGKDYLTKHGLEYHLDNNHIDSSAKMELESHKKVHRCSTCSYQTGHLSHLRKHETVHLAPEERQLLSCAHCNLKYRTKTGLQYHLAKNHLDSSAKIEPQKKENGRKMNKSQKKVHKCSTCSYQTGHLSHFRKHKEVHAATKKRQFFACAHCDKKYWSKVSLQRHLQNNHIISRSEKTTILKNLKVKERNADCMSLTHEVILDSLKIEIDEQVTHLDRSNNTESLSVANEVKSEACLETEIDDDAPILNKDVQDDFRTTDDESVTKKVKLEEFIKMEPNLDAFLDEDLDLITNVG